MYTNGKKNENVQPDNNPRGFFLICPIILGPFLIWIAGTWIWLKSQLQAKLWASCVFFPMSFINTCLISVLVLFLELSERMEIRNLQVTFEFAFFFFPCSLIIPPKFIVYIIQESLTGFCCGYGIDFQNIGLLFLLFWLNFVIFLIMESWVEIPIWNLHN